jgi:hypothetical protein
VPHPEPAVLALRALGEAVGSADDERHIAACAQCRSELARLAEVAALARRSGTAETLSSPPPRVWERIAAAAAGPASLAGTGAAAAGGASPRVRPAGQASRGHGLGGQAARWLSGRLSAALSGLAIGLAAGAAAATGIAQLTSGPPPARVLARIALRPLPRFPQWRHVAGTAVMQAAAAGRILDVRLRAPRLPGFYEVWLLGRNGVSMISLGDLSTARTGRFVIPPGTDLKFYSRVDVSLQPFNGSTLHSKVSVVRGALPPAALGGRRTSAVARQPGRGPPSAGLSAGNAGRAEGGG